MIDITSRLPPTAATGKPPPRPLAIVVRSGRTPKYSWAPPLANRKPVITSSKISSAPCREVPEQLQVTGLRKDAASVEYGGLGDDRRYLFSALGHDGREALGIVPRQHDQGVGELGRDARPRWNGPWPARGAGDGWVH